MISLHLGNMTTHIALGTIATRRQEAQERRQGKETVMDKAGTTEGIVAQEANV